MLLLLLIYVFCINEYEEYNNQSTFPLFPSYTTRYIQNYIEFSFFSPFSMVVHFHSGRHHSLKKTLIYIVCFDAFLDKQ